MEKTSAEKPPEEKGGLTHTGPALPMPGVLTVNEIFLSLQGESTHSGFPSVFVRLTGCNLRCRYCDTAYAHEEGSRMKIGEIVKSVEEYRCRTVQITGGEPMLQPGTVVLASRLLEKGYGVMLETNGSIDLSPLPKEVVKIVDIKCPSSGADETFHLPNLDSLSPRDEIKFVVASKDDFDWAVREAERLDLPLRCTVNVSPVYGVAEPTEVARWILDSGKNFRLNLPLHKLLWGEKRGV